MKKYLVLVAIISCSLLFLSSCGSKSTLSKEKETFIGSDGKEYTNYQEACRAQDFEVAFKFFDILHDKYVKALGDDNTFESSEIDEERKEYYSALDYIYKQEIMYLASIGDEASSNRIAFLLQEVPVEGNCNPGLTSWIGKDEDAYIEAIRHYNDLCNTALDLAISQGNKSLASKIIRLYKQNVEIIEGDNTGKVEVNGIIIDNTHFYFKFNDIDKEHAQTKFDEAASSGAFD